MLVDAFDFTLPEDLIALRPKAKRELARMLVIAGTEFQNAHVGNFPEFLRPGDVLVVNNTKVIPVSLRGLRPARMHGGSTHQVPIDVTLHKRLSTTDWAAFVRPAKRLRPGDELHFGPVLKARVKQMEGQGEATLSFNETGQSLDAAIHSIGAMPLPPYIASKRKIDEQDSIDYQTIFARQQGAIAAPTAGLHFTPALMAALERKGIGVVEVTLHVGAGTFLPVKVADTQDHVMHSEWGEITPDAARALNRARKAGNALIAVGTTSLRVLESAARQDGMIDAFSQETAIFITPGYQFKSADMLLTNFHLPRSTLFMLVSAFAGGKVIQDAYAQAIREKYRFYSYGDACLIQRYDREGFLER